MKKKRVQYLIYVLVNIVGIYGKEKVKINYNNIEQNKTKK